MRRLLICAVCLAGCSDASGDPALDALLRVPGAQFYRGATPTAEDGPKVDSLLNSSNLIRPGQSKSVTGIVARESRGVAVFLQDDVGYWIVSPGNSDPTALNHLAFRAGLSFSPLLPNGKYTLAARAVDEQGRFGPAQTAELKTLDQAVDGKLVVTLKWDTEVDLDLRLTDPNGIEVSAKNRNTAVPPNPGDPPNPDAYKNGGALDFDSNAQCVIDGRRQEDVVWTAPPQSGHYIVRVDTYAMCAEYQAYWTVAVLLDGNVIGAARGASREVDTLGSHDKGAGVTAVEFDVP
jgi:hypothetical protein